MRYLLLAFLFVTHLTSSAQQLPLSTADTMVRSLTAQQVLTTTGREEVMRFVNGQPLKIYEGLDTAALRGITLNIFVADAGIIDMTPGQTRVSKPLLDSLSAIKTYPWTDHENEFAEEYFLESQFPTRRDVYKFIMDAADFYRYNHNSDLSYDTTKSLLTKRLGAWFGSAMAPVFNDSTIEFSVSDATDNIPAQQERVKTYAPYLSWVHVFKQAGFLPETDSVIEHYYHNGKNIYGSVSHTGFLSEVGKYILYLDKYPYFKQQQLRQLDSLQQAGLIDATGKEQIIARFRPNTLLSSDDIFPYCQTAVPLYNATDIVPYDFIPKNYYGLIEPKSIETLMQRVVEKISGKLFPLTATDIQVHKLKPGANGLYPYEEQLALSRSSKLMSVTLRLNKHLYKEVIDEKEFESWIRPENFQFLNHYLEDQQDNRRFFFITPNRFTNYEAQQPDTAFLALLTQKQWKLLQTRYLFDRIEGCYNGSPGDYDYTVYPADYYSPERRLSKAQIDSFTALCQQHTILPAQDTDYLTAAIREHNPSTYAEVLAFAPGYFNCENELLRLVSTTQEVLQQLLPANKYQIKAESDEDIRETGTLLKKVNTSLDSTNIPYRLYALAANQDIFTGGNLNGQGYILLKPATAAVLQKYAANLFYKKESSRD